ncbi:MAG: hypothetical protein V7641_4161 [Blastocatellia bacterium]
MKTMALLFLLSVSTLVVSAQSSNINQPTPPVAIRSARVVEFSICYEGLGGDNGAPPWQDRFNGPGTLVRLDIGNTSSNPEEFTSNEATFLAQMGNAKPSVKVTAKALFSIAIKNTGAKRIKALRFQFLFSNLATGAPYASYEKRMRVKIKPGEEKWLSSQVSMRKAPDNLLKAINSGQNKNDIELLLVEYDDGSVWSRP